MSARCAVMYVGVKYMDFVFLYDFSIGI